MDRKFKTTFFSDLTIADKFGEAAVRDTYERCFKEWKSDVRYFTEFVVALNRKLCQHYEEGDMKLARVYDELRQTADTWARDNYKWEDEKYYRRETD